MSPRLILINGAPASGKTTLARAWCARHAAELPLALDIDALRAMLGGWQDDLHAAGLAARELAVAAISVHLASGRDVMVPQYLRRVEFVERLEATAANCGAVFVETALRIDAATAAERFDRRAASLGGADIHSTLPAEMAAVVEDFERFLLTRPRVVRIPSGEGPLAALDAAVAAASG
ncbi:AAA family ATPase [Leifsonia shinshuensis]|uniref:AAA family ATPase n=1 Tax=Leifsonia shinshuensis TaxID=150026 RepID=UPI00162855E4|nr:AAA family ATPase [Leifsonia shinshuensis]